MPGLVLRLLHQNREVHARNFNPAPKPRKGNYKGKPFLFYVANATRFDVTDMAGPGLRREDASHFNQLNKPTKRRNLKMNSQFWGSLDKRRWHGKSRSFVRLPSHLPADEVGPSIDRHLDTVFLPLQNRHRASLGSALKSAAGERMQSPTS